MRRWAGLALAAIAVLAVGAIPVSGSAAPAEVQVGEYEVLVLGSVGDAAGGGPGESLISSGWHDAGRPIHGRARPAGSVDLIAKGPGQASYGANVYARFAHVSAPGSASLTFRISTRIYHSNCKGLHIRVMDAAGTAAEIEYIHVKPRRFWSAEQWWTLSPGETKTVLLGQLAWTEHEGCGWTGAHLHLWAYGTQVVGNAAIHDRADDPAERDDYPCVDSTWLFKIATSEPGETARRPDCLTLRHERERAVLAAPAAPGARPSEADKD